MFDVHPPPDAASLVPGYAHIRETEDGTMYVKVAGLPAPAGTFDSEVIWVRIVQGDPAAGLGIVNNRPVFCTEVGYGDKIEWKSADGNSLPVYVGVNTPAAELVPLAPPPSAAAPAATVGRAAPAMPVEGTRYSTRYGQWFEFQGDEYMPIETPTETEAAAPTPAPTPTPTATPVATRPAPPTAPLSSNVRPGPIGTQLPARFAKTGHPGLPTVNEKVVQVPARMAGRPLPVRPTATPAPTAVPARVGRRRSQTGGSVQVPASHAHHRPAAATSEPVPVPARVAAQQDREAKAAAIRQKRADAVAAKAAVEEAATEEARVAAQTAALKIAAEAAVAEAAAEAEAQAAQAATDAQAAADAAAETAAIVVEDLGDIELEPEVAAEVEAKVEQAEDLGAVAEADA